MFEKTFHNDVFRMVLLFAAVTAMCRFTYGATAVVVALAGAMYAISKRPGPLAVCYVMFPYFIVVNREILGLNPVTAMTARFGNFFMIMVMLLSGAGLSGRPGLRLPITWMFAYAGVAVLSSIDGWMPLISFLKLFQYVLFLIGILFVARIMQQSDNGLHQLRCAFMALAVIFLWGSVAAYFVPSVGFSLQISRMAEYGVYATGKDLVEGKAEYLFNGLTCHSQILAPVVALLSTYVLCDMLLVERHFSWLHVSLFSVAPMLLYMSRSRGGFLEFIATMSTAIFVCVPRARLTQMAKNKLMQLLLFASVVIFVVAVVAQVRDQSISKWLRKTDDVGGDTRSLKEAFTGSRQGLVEYNLRDFKKNPFLGKGFQVVEGMDAAYKAGYVTWYSAVVEKGVTPYVILGETGIVGAIVFLIFLFVFYTTCLARRYLALLSMFTCVLVANLADSTMFSPSGLGGFMWIASCIGGFGIDLIALRQSQCAFSPTTEFCCLR